MTIFCHFLIFFSKFLTLYLTVGTNASIFPHNCNISFNCDLVFHNCDFLSHSCDFMSQTCDILISVLVYLKIMIIFDNCDSLSSKMHKEPSILHFLTITFILFTLREGNVLPLEKKTSRS